MRHLLSPAPEAAEAPALPCCCIVAHCISSLAKTATAIVAVRPTLPRHWGLQAAEAAQAPALPCCWRLAFPACPTQLLPSHTSGCSGSSHPPCRAAKNRLPAAPQCRTIAAHGGSVRLYVDGSGYLVMRRGHRRRESSSIGGEDHIDMDDVEGDGAVAGGAFQHQKHVDAPYPSTLCSATCNAPPRLLVGMGTPPSWQKCGLPLRLWRQDVPQPKAPEVRAAWLSLACQAGQVLHASAHLNQVNQCAHVKASPSNGEQTKQHLPKRRWGNASSNKTEECRIAKHKKLAGHGLGEESPRLALPPVPLHASPGWLPKQESRAATVTNMACNTNTPTLATNTYVRSPRCSQPAACRLAANPCWPGGPSAPRPSAPRHGQGCVGKAAGRRGATARRRPGGLGGTGPRPGSRHAHTCSVAPQVWQRMLCSAPPLLHCGILTSTV